VIGKTNEDDRLYTKEFVVGVELENGAVAYPFSVLNEEPVVNDSIAEKDLLVVFDPQGGTGLVYDRNVDGRLLTFTQDAESMTVIDEETGTVWDAFSGKALEGLLVGKQLDRVKSTIVFWFGWVDFHPDTLVYSIG